MMGYIKSKFSGTAIYLGVIMSIFVVPVGIVFMFKIFKYIFLGNIKGIGDVLLLLFFISLFFFALNMLKHVRYLIVKDDRLTYYSLLRPFGKTLYFSDYIGRIFVQERGSGGRYTAMYFIDKNNRTAFKIMELFYKNFEKIVDNIPLETIDFNPDTGEYFKLLYFEKITIKESSINKGSNKTLNKILLVFQIISIIGLMLLIITTLLKRVLS